MNAISPCNSISLRLKEVSKSYSVSCDTGVVLQGIDLTIEAGEMIAIQGASGSGKSSLLHILGTLDLPTSGDYSINGVSIQSMNLNQFAELRAKHFGFVFQRYHLLNNLNIIENVSMPLLYSGYSVAQARERACQYLNYVGLSDKKYFFPSQLSGGQQQRVAIARALVNGGSVIFADEPTGALDSTNGQQVMQLFSALNASGYTIVYVTHDSNVAAYAKRIIQIEDGVIVRDCVSNKAAVASRPSRHPMQVAHLPVVLTKFASINAIREAIRSMLRLHFQNLLTVMGVAIGIAAILSVVAVGEGTKHSVLQSIASLGTNSIQILQDVESKENDSYFSQLALNDVEFLKNQGLVLNASPVVQMATRVSSASASFDIQLLGVTEEYFDIHRGVLLGGTYFNENQSSYADAVVVLTEKSSHRLFGSRKDVIGSRIIIGGNVLTLIGVIKEEGIGNDDFVPMKAYIPYVTFAQKFNSNSKMFITATASDDVPHNDSLRRIYQALELKRGVRDFLINSNERIRENILSSSENLSRLIAFIASVSLFVSGIGVMNMMLVTVSKRSAEIGLRMAVGASRTSIMIQFLVESLLLCTIGAILGMLLAFGVNFALALIWSDLMFVVSWKFVFYSIGSAFLVGLIFGYVPARKAADMTPAHALVS